MVILSDELKQAAQALGQALQATDVVQTYLDAQARLQANPEARALAESLQELYGNLLARQQAGEPLAPAEVDEFYALRSRAQSHPLIAERDAALNQLKGYFAEVALKLSVEVGLDYVALAKATEEDDSDQQ